MSTSESKSDLRQTAQKLSESYYALLQHTTLTTETIAQHVQQLATYSNDLPFSWFTTPFIDALLALPTDSAEVVTLLAGWSRRLAGAPDVLYTMRDRLTLVLQRFQDILLAKDGDMKAQKEAWIGYVAVVGHSPPTYPDTKILEVMTKMIMGMDGKDSRMGESMDAGLAHVLAHTNTLNEFEMTSCQSLLEAYIQFAAARGEEGARALMHAMEHAVDVRSQGKPEAKAEAEVVLLVKMVNDVIQVEDKGAIQVQFSRLAILAGVVRMLQFNQGVKTKKIRAARDQAEKTFMQQLDISLSTLTGHEVQQYQDTVSFLAGRCLLQIPNEIVGAMEMTTPLLKVLTGTLFTSRSTLQNGEILHSDNETLKALVEDPLFKDLGRISRILAKLIQIAIDKEEGPAQIQYIIEKMVGLSYNIYFDWDHHQMYNNKQQLDHAAAWTYLKAISFSFTVLLKSIAVDIPDGRGLVVIPHAAQDIISIYGNLHFITEQVEGGGAGVEAYQDTLTNAVAYLLHKDHQCQLDRFISLAFKEYGTNAFTSDSTDTVELLSNLQQSRLTFFTDLVEQVVGPLDDKVFENDILPVIYPILKWKKVENKNLYESAHTAVISAFIAEKPVSRELAGVYGKILIDNFPEPMNLDQFRYGFSTLIQALCGLDDALAWLTVNQLVVQIESLPLESQLRQDYTIALIDMLKPLSLGPFFPRILDKVEELVLKKKEGMGKILFETVSGSGISDMRRAEAVGWFLELKHKL
ncbi:hypothetical protein K501DRAFT_245947 [Backusella circina FSU 941]|nr:hypothetical protein K501DRAFT_245947 [Backusella circina FSU 941]